MVLPKTRGGAAWGGVSALVALALLAVLVGAMPVKAVTPESPDVRTVPEASATDTTTDAVTVEIDDMEFEQAPLAANREWYEIDSIPSGPVRGDFVVGPGKIELTIPPGTSQTVIVNVSNRIGEERRFALQVEDMQASQSLTETVELLGEREGPYSLRDYISIPGNEVVVGHNQKARVPVTITIPPDAEPGGRYGSVLVNTVAVPRTEGSDTVAPTSPIIARIGTLFFVTVPGDVERSGTLVDFTTIPDRSWFSTGPIEFAMTFDNSGSIHLAPYGSLSVTNMYGDEVGFVEIDPWFVLPGALRLRETFWNREHLLGRYTATLTMNRSYDDIVDTRTVTFWVVPWHYLVGVVVGLTFFILFVRFLLNNFEFKRKGA